MAIWRSALAGEIHADGVSGHINQRNNGTDLVGLVKRRTDGTGELLEWGITQRRAGRDMAELITEAIRAGRISSLKTSRAMARLSSRRISFLVRLVAWRWT